MKHAARLLTLAVVFSASPALGAEGAPVHQQGAQHDTTHPIQDRRSPATPSQTENAQDHTHSSACSCQHDSKVASGVQPEQDFGETAQWPAN